MTVQSATSKGSAVLLHMQSTYTHVLIHPKRLFICRNTTVYPGTYVSFKKNAKKYGQRQKFLRTYRSRHDNFWRTDCFI